MDWTIPVSIAVFFAGLLTSVLVALPRVRAVHELREMHKQTRGRVQDLAESFAEFRGKDYQKLSREHQDLTAKVNTLQNTVAAKQMVR